MVKECFQKVTKSSTYAYDKDIWANLKSTWTDQKGTLADQVALGPLKYPTFCNNSVISRQVELQLAL